LSRSLRGDLPLPDAPSPDDEDRWPSDENTERERLLLPEDTGGVDVAVEREADGDGAALMVCAGADVLGSKRLVPIFVPPLLLITMPPLPEYPAGRVDT
jgi:hypothetical protein